VAEKVTQLDQVALNEQRYHLVPDSRVRPTLASLYPPKRVEGDFDADSDPRRSIVRWSRFTRGVGFRKSRDNEFEKLGYSTLWTIVDGAVTLPPKVTEAASSSVSGTMTALVDYTIDSNTVILAALNGGTDIYAYDDANDDWSLAGSGATKLHDIPGAAATDAIRFVLSGTEYAAFAGQTAWAYSSDHTDPANTWVDRAEPVDFFAFTDGKLWLIDNNGALSWTLDPAATPTSDANLQDDFAIQDGDVTSMFVGPDATGEPIIYVGTKIGLFAHDDANDRFLKTVIDLPRGGISTGKGARTWNGRIYFPDGLSVYEYDPRQGFYRDIGFTGEAWPSSDLFDSVMGTAISATANAGWALLVAIDPDNPQGLDGDGDGVTGMTPQVFGWNGQAWHSIAKTITRNGDPIEAMLVSDSYAVNRLWMSMTVSSGVARLQHATLPRALIHPIGFNAIATNSGAGSMETPWFDAGNITASKLALSVRFDVIGADANRTIAIIADINDDDATVNTALGTVNSQGVTTFTFPGNVSTDVGTAFNSIRFRLAFASNDTTKSPKLQSITFEYRKKLTPKYGFEFDVDLTRGQPDGVQPRAAFDNIITALEKNTLVEFNYESETGGTRNAYVDVAAFTGAEIGGMNPQGQFRVTVVEP
jgi:hypothetical protein